MYIHRKTRTKRFPKKQTLILTNESDSLKCCVQRETSPESEMQVNKRLLQHVLNATNHPKKCCKEGDVLMQDVECVAFTVKCTQSKRDDDSDHTRMYDPVPKHDWNV